MEVLLWCNRPFRKNGYRFSVFYLIHFLSHKGTAKRESAVLLFHNHSSDAYSDALMEKLWIICFKLLLPIIFISTFYYSQAKYPFSNFYPRPQANNSKILSVTKNPQELDVCASIICTNIFMNQKTLHTWLGLVLRAVAVSCAGSLVSMLQEEVIPVIY